MRSTENLAKLLAPVAMQRFRLASEPLVQVVTGAGLGMGVKFRVELQGHYVGLIESHISVGQMLSKAKHGATLKFDNNGRCHEVTVETTPTKA
jgi:hypothetical protein